MKGVNKLFYFIVIVLLIGAIIYIYPEIEWHPPKIDIKLASDYIGLKPFDIQISDKGKGLKKVTISLKVEDGESILVDKVYDSPVKEETFTIELDPKKTGIKDGPAELMASAEDRSHFKLFYGNKTKLSKKVKIDLVPPKAEIVSGDQYINHGGSALVIYKTSEDVNRSGVEIGEYFFPGHGGYFEDPNIYLAFFAFPYTLSTENSISLIAEDQAGNTKRVSIPHRVKNVKYKKSDINVSDKFIEEKMAPLLDGDSSKDQDLKAIFLKVNRDLRKKNNDEIQKIGEDTSKQILWDGEFHQLTNSKVEANFADDRTYFFEGEPIDEQYHLGYDLAVTKRYPVEVGNDGVVVFAGGLGIYGNSVIVDHGMGISTLYGHLSSIDVDVGDAVKKKRIIGRTGETGLAAGDHLHYGVYVNGVPVRPIEWWDQKWINDNILKKIREAEVEFKTSQIGDGSTPKDVSQEKEVTKEN
ncbi:MAG: M23 family metallopeptidase [Deltaproteobacteria bacterium]|nr:M23 family metallopeptidase [Deltaproteobacteria bacterium]